MTLDKEIAAKVAQLEYTYSALVQLSSLAVPLQLEYDKLSTELMLLRQDGTRIQEEIKYVYRARD